VSHYSTIETAFFDPDVLVQTLEELEPQWVVERHTIAVPLFGYQNDMRPEKAEIVVRRQYVGHASNDIGFVLQGGRYKAIISEYDSHRHGSEWLGKLTQLYAKNKTLKELRKHGWRQVGNVETRQNGSLKLTIEV
jgi:Protein of unknown function (DUF1257)